MAKNDVRSWDSTASNNTDIAGIGIQGTNLPSNFDNALRTVMAQIADVDGGVQPLNDTFTLCDPTDTTKRGRFDCVGITTATTRVYTLPDAAGTLPLIGTAQTWTATQTWTGVAEPISLRSTGVGTGQAFIRFRDSAATAIGFVGLGSAVNDTLSITRNTTGNIAIDALSGGTITLTGVATFGQAVTITGAATLSSTLGVTGAATLSSTLNVTGTTTLGTATITTANVTTANFGTYSSSGASKGVQIDSDGFRSSVAVTTAVVHSRYVNPNGTVGSVTTNASATAFNTSSDKKKKVNWRAFDSGSIIDSLDAWLFDWKNGAGSAYGVLAQDAHEVFPDAVTVDEENGWGVDYSKFVPLLLREVKQLRNRLAILEASK